MSSTPESSTSTPSNHDITLLRQEIANIIRQELAATRRPADNDNESDPQIRVQTPFTEYSPSEDEARRYPAIRPSDPLSFFKTEINDADFKEALRPFPKNRSMGYKAPKIPSVIYAQSSGTAKAQDSQLRSVQERLAELTRPTHMFLHQMWSLQNRDDLDPEELLELSTEFAMFMCDQLAGLAGKINKTRLDNLRTSQGAAHQDDSLDIVDPHKFQEEIKSIRALTKAFQPRQKVLDGRRDRKGGDSHGNNSHGNRHGNNGNWRDSDNYNRRSRSRSRRDNDNNNRSSFHRGSRNQRGNSQHRGRSSSRRRDRSPESADGSRDS